MALHIFGAILVGVFQVFFDFFEFWQISHNVPLINQRWQIVGGQFAFVQSHLAGLVDFFA